MMGYVHNVPKKPSASAKRPADTQELPAHDKFKLEQKSDLSEKQQHIVQTILTSVMTFEKGEDGLVTLQDNRIDNLSIGFEEFVNILEIPDPGNDCSLLHSMFRKLQIFRYDPSLASLIIPSEVNVAWNLKGIDGSEPYVLMKHMFEKNDVEVCH